MLNSKIAQIAIAAAIAAAPHAERVITNVWNSRVSNEEKIRELERQTQAQITTAVEQALVAQAENTRRTLWVGGLMVFALGLLIGAAVGKFYLVGTAWPIPR